WSLPRLIWHLEDLRAGMSYQNYYIARLASRFVKVVLAGIGGDELFAGYPWRYQTILDARDDDDFDQRYYRYWCRLLRDEDRYAAFSSTMASALGEVSPFEHYRDIAQRAKGLDPLSRALYFELKTFLHGILVVEDKLAMAHSLESRVPFLDDELVAVAARVPSGAKM